MEKEKPVDFFRQTKLPDGKLQGFEEDENVEELEDKLKEENYYKYHENVQDYDPRG